LENPVIERMLEEMEEVEFMDQTSQLASTVSPPLSSHSFQLMPQLDVFQGHGPSKPSSEVFPPYFNISMALDSIITSIPVLNLSGPSPLGSIFPFPLEHPTDKTHYNLHSWDKREFPDELVGGLGFL